MKGQAGRPKSIDGKEILTIDDCIKRLQEELGLEKPPYTRRTILNKICKKELVRYGLSKVPMLDWNEFRRKAQYRKKVV